MRQQVLLVMLFLLLLAGCNFGSRHEALEELAKVGDMTLYSDELPRGFAHGLNPADSLRAQEAWVEEWKSRTEQYHRAEKALGDNHAGIRRRVEDYRRSLYIALYEEAYLRKHLDTGISANELAAYYAQHKHQLLLDAPRYRVLVVEAPRDYAQLWQIRRMLQDTSAVGIQKLSTASVSEGFHILSSPECWYTERELSAMLPSGLGADAWGRGRRRLELQGGESIYLVELLAKLDSGAVAPMQCAQSRIRQLVLHQRELDMLGVLRSGKGEANRRPVQGNAD